MSEKMISDDEPLFRRIPPGEPWLEASGRITSANFKLRRGELGLSVYRARILSAEKVLNKREAIPGSSVAQATAGEVRALKNGKGEPLHLDVVAVDDEHDPGHAEIRGPVPEKLSNSAAVALRNEFKSVRPMPEER